MPNINKFFKEYTTKLNQDILNLDLKKLNLASNLIKNTIKKGKTIYVCGNGGSAAIANHYVCDFLKYFRQRTKFKPKIISLSNNIETITAIANDISYDEVFVHQLRLSAGPGDLLLTISASGDSENVVRAASWSRENSIDVISLTGFDGGRTAEIATVNLHVDGDNYGIVEDMHQSLMHLMGQYIRQHRMSEDLIQSSKF